MIIYRTYRIDTQEVTGELVALEGNTPTVLPGEGFFISVGDVPLDIAYYDPEKDIEWFKDRIEIPVPQSGPAPLVIDLNDYPEGTELVVYTNQGHFSFTDKSEPVRITTPGTYQLHIRVPYPYVSFEGEVEVLDA